MNGLLAGKPLIDPGYLSHPRDRRALVDGVPPARDNNSHRGVNSLIASLIAAFGGGTCLAKESSCAGRWWPSRPSTASGVRSYR